MRFSLLLLLALLLAAPVPDASAQVMPPPGPDPGDLTLTVETDKATYAYGETILVTTRVRNVSDDRVYLGCPGFECVAPAWSMDDVFVFGPACVDMCEGPGAYAILSPGQEVVHTSDVVPAEHFLPYAEGATHTISAVYSNGLTASTEINAPQFEQGNIWVYFPEDQATEVDGIQTALEATVVRSYFFNGGGTIPPRYEEEWLVKGVSGEQAVALYEDDPAFAGSEFYGLHVASRSIDLLNVTVAEESDEVVGEVSLSASPNPFANRTTLSLALPAAQRVEAAACDVLGRRVAVLHDGPLGAGTHALPFEAADLPAGIYVVRVRTSGPGGDGLALTRRVTLVR